MLMDIFFWPWVIFQIIHATSFIVLAMGLQWALKSTFSWKDSFYKATVAYVVFRVVIEIFYSLWSLI